MNDPKHSAEESYPPAVGLEDVAQLTGVGVFHWCPATNETRWSENLFRLLGLDPEVSTPSFRWWLGRVHAADRERVQVSLDSLARGEAHPHLDYRMLLDRGQVRHLRSMIANVERGVGDPGWISGVVLDITELAAAERELDTFQAVASALVEWGAFGSSVMRLLKLLTRALQLDLAVMWVPGRLSGSS